MDAKGSTEGTIYTGFNLRPDERSLLKEVAQERGLSMTAVIRELILGLAGKRNGQE